MTIIGVKPILTEIEKYFFRKYRAEIIKSREKDNLYFLRNFFNIFICLVKTNKYVLKVNLEEVRRLITVIDRKESNVNRTLAYDPFNVFGIDDFFHDRNCVLAGIQPNHTAFIGFRNNILNLIDG